MLQEVLAIPLQGFCSLAGFVITSPAYSRVVVLYSSVFPMNNLFVLLSYWLGFHFKVSHIHIVFITIKSMNAFGIMLFCELPHFSSFSNWEHKSVRIK